MLIGKQRQTFATVLTARGESPGVAPRPARRPDGKARRPRISGIFEGGATQPAGMHRRPNGVPSAAAALGAPNAAGLSPRTVNWRCRESDATWRHPALS